MYTEDTIAAICTAPGPAAVGIVRVSGPDAESISNIVFKRRASGRWASHRLYRGRVLDARGRPFDDALAVIMRGPRSYTGETVLEIHCHGSPAVLGLVLESALRAGARPAEPGEFTKRAFLNGRLDLTQAEAVADLVAARSPATARNAAAQLAGSLSERLERLRQHLIRAKGLLEIRIDFSEEDVEVDDMQLREELGRAARGAAELIETYTAGRVLREGLRVVIAGPPNVGKSSLLNALLGEERAIVTDTPGTTRDVIEESAQFADVPVVLTDTAGLRDADDDAERLGVERASRTAGTADVVLAVYDGSISPPAAFHAFGDSPTVGVLNKIDLPCVWATDAIEELDRVGPLVRVSALRGLGLERLRDAVLAVSGARPPTDRPVLTSRRHRDGLAKVREAVLRAARACALGEPPDLVAVDAQLALDHVAELTGSITADDVLGAVFSEFCIGK